MWNQIKMCALFLFIAVFLSSCATPPIQGNLEQMTEMKSDFASGIAAVVDYVTDGERTFIVLDVENPSKLHLDIWLSQTYLSVGAESIRKRRLTVSSQDAFQRTIRASKLEEGVREIILFEIFDAQGKVLFVTEPITNDNGMEPVAQVAQTDPIVKSVKNDTKTKYPPIVQLGKPDRVNTALPVRYTE